MSKRKTKVHKDRKCDEFYVETLCGVVFEVAAGRVTSVWSVVDCENCKARRHFEIHHREVINQAAI